ncbi:hypothetical protein GAGA_2912 [Paraglaciecola agarilytica NO2]|uniref:Uncharacterized protein n=1 Tax=Paraglaciecola agarilytica NO2 TaxID=1125747 RepID=A0ABQ0I8T9_9ALTE|nr:hypothetical protein GAGA_2912 [Paraglaciecola agarilytica NO2]
MVLGDKVVGVLNSFNTDGVSTVCGQSKSVKVLQRFQYNNRLAILRYSSQG